MLVVERSYGQTVYFVNETSIVRQIWGRSDTVLFIFAGAAAEFALNKAVDWLYYTGKLPADPIGRLFSTVAYAHQIIFLPEAEAHKAIDQISALHQSLEARRGYQIPDWAYRDVLYMLIHYSISAFELLDRKLTEQEKTEIYDVFKRLGQRMGLSNLPANYTAWLPDRDEHMNHDLLRSAFTDDLFHQYRRQLGRVRYGILREAQNLVVPKRIAEMLSFGKTKLLKPAIVFYRWNRRLGLENWIKALLLPGAYREKIASLDRF